MEQLTSTQIPHEISQTIHSFFPISSEIRNNKNITLHYPLHSAMAPTIRNLKLITKHPVGVSAVAWNRIIQWPWT